MITLVIIYDTVFNIITIITTFQASRKVSTISITSAGKKYKHSSVLKDLAMPWVPHVPTDP